MEAKMFEVRDRGTIIPVVAVLVDPDYAGNEPQRYLLRRAGYGPGTGMVLLTKATARGCAANYDPHQWVGNRTMRVAHDHIAKNWFTLVGGEVVDVEFILGQSAAPKASECFEQPL